jgi:hypothetical protein
MRLTGEQTLTGNLSFLDDTYTFSGAKPSQIGYLSGVTSSIQTQLNNCAPKAHPTFTGTVSIPATTSTGVITFANSMGLGTDLSAARMVLWPGTGNEWYGLV